MPEAGKPRLARETAFLLKFLGLLTLFFALVAPKPLNEALVTPFTERVAAVSGAVCRLLGAPVETNGTQITSPRFSVEIKNGCNGLETILIFAAGILAFPAPWRLRLYGLLFGLAAIQAINTVRIVSLYFIGVHLPKLFDSSHNVIWQAVVLLFGIALFVLWAGRYAIPALREEAPR